MSTPSLPSIEETGKGIWITIHTLAKNAFTEEEKRAFLAFINSLAKTFYCKKCQVHFLQYLEKHPIIKHWHASADSIDGGDHISGMFIWSWEFHNEVNKYLKKPLLTLEDAYQLYNHPDGCDTCGLKEMPIIEERTPIYEPLKYGYNSLLRRVDTGLLSPSGSSAR